MTNTLIKPKEEINEEKGLPQGWVNIEVSFLGDIVTGTTPSKNNPDFYANDYPFYKPTDLDYGYYVKKATDNLSDEGVKKARLLKEKSTLVTCIGATIGKTGFIRKDGACNQQINAIVPSIHLYPEFIYFICISPQFQKDIKDNASSTTLPILNKGRFEKLSFPIPPRPEQVRIVEKIEELFSNIDAGIQKLEQAKLQIKQYKQSVLKSAFEGKLYKTTEWKETTLGNEITPKRNRINPNKDNEEMIFIGMDCIEPNSLFIHNQYKFKETKSTAFLFDKNDVLYGRMRSYLNKVFKAEFSGAASAEFIVFPENDKLDSDFLKYLLHQQEFVRFASRNASGDRPRVKFEADLAPYKFNLPTYNEQQIIVEEIEKRFEVAEVLEKAVIEGLEKSRQLKQSILKKAFEGRLVPQDPSDEPASILLERIKAEKAVLASKAKQSKTTKTSKSLRGMK